MKLDLENIMQQGRVPGFKSEGEKRIAYFLDTNSIKYRYESGVLVNGGNEKPRIWYPDFYLPEFGTYIEYYGMAGHSEYDQGIKVKETVYAKSGMDVISVYPRMFRDDWQGYIMRELEKATLRRYRKLMSKPYWSRHKNTTSASTVRMNQGYGKRLGKLY
jgi:hypothetical protein